MTLEPPTYEEQARRVLAGMSTTAKAFMPTGLAELLLALAKHADATPPNPTKEHA